MTWVLLGLLAAICAAAWWTRSRRQRFQEAAGLRCAACGRNLRGYERSPTCPHCYAILSGDDDDDDTDEPDSVDEIDEDYEEARRW